MMKLRASAHLEMNDEMTNFEDWEDDEFEDPDHELLFRQRFDGIEDLPPEHKLGFVHLRFDEWFVPFGPPRRTSWTA